MMCKSCHSRLTAVRTVLSLQGEVKLTEMVCRNCLRRWTTVTMIYTEISDDGRGSPRGLREMADSLELRERTL